MATHHPEKHKSKAPEQSSSQKREQSIEPTSSASPRPLQRGGYGFGPFSLMRQLTEDMDRLFGGFFGPGLYPLGAWPSRPEPSSTPLGFWPEVEVAQTGNKLVVQADLPGLKKDDVTLEVRDNQLIISGERRSESERTEGGYFQSERSYGSFRRVIPLPRGAKAEEASATFDNGVLKIEMTVPGEEGPKGRRIEVREGSAH